MTRPRLILLCGLPGSGKTTLAKRLETEVPAVRLCPDEWLAALGIDLFDERSRTRLEGRFRTLAQDLLRLGQSVILENGFWSRAERAAFRQLGHSVGAAVELRYLAVPLDELIRRVTTREAGPSLTPELMAEYWRLFEPPTEAELGRFDQP